MVVAVVAVVSIGGALLAVLGSGSGGTTPAGRKIPGISLGAVPARSVLSPIISEGTPPNDVVGNLAVPAGAHRTASACTGGIDLYDCNVSMSVAAQPKAVVAFYTAELARQGWTKLGIDATADGRGTEVIEQRPGADGFYWEVGVVVDPVSPSISPALAGRGETTPTSAVELRLFEREDGT
ncbi:MAG: hypothetical protein JWM85_1909 [Acidimicrobiaceae bacterium]|nr:hypothetical protein [Acidimicrobiaceae bacterium]